MVDDELNGAQAEEGAGGADVVQLIDGVCLEVDLSRPQRFSVVGRDGRREVRRTLVVTAKRRIDLD